MDGINAFCQSNMPVIYGIYGLAFVVTGVIVALESTRESRLALARALPFLAAFGLTHGVHEWIEMFQLIAPAQGFSPAQQARILTDSASIILLAVSFILLVEFAARLASSLDPHRRKGWSWLAPTLTIVYLSALVAYRLFVFNGDERLFWTVADILARYLLGVTGAALACWAMFAQRRAFQREGYAQFGRDLIGAALAFAWYSFLQFIAPPSPYFPSSLFNTGTFLSFTGIPVQLVRAGVVSILAFFVIRVMRVFEIEYSRRLEALNRARFEAQEAAARELSVLYETTRILGATLDLNCLLAQAIRAIVMLVEPVRAGWVYLVEAHHRAPSASVVAPPPNRLILRAHHSRSPISMSSATARSAVAARMRPPQHDAAPRSGADALSARPTAQASDDPAAQAHWATASLPPTACAVAQRVVETKEVCFVSVPNDDYQNEQDQLALVAIPLVAAERAIGALCLAHEGAFANFAVMQTLARQIVIAIENAWLYEQVQEKEELRGQLLERVVSAQEEERKRLARDLHDQTGQTLTALGLGISSVAEMIARDPAGAQRQIENVKQMSANAIADLRRFIADLRPALLDDLGLVAALREMAKQVEAASRGGLTVQLQITGARRRLRSQTETVLYRIAQEALNNTVRHAHATHACVALDFREQSVVLTVSDDGMGFSPAALLSATGKRRAWGLLGIQERAQLVGGVFDVQSAPGQGTRLTAEVPYADEVANDTS